MGNISERIRRHHKCGNQSLIPGLWSRRSLTESRPWSRISRRRWSISTLNDPFSLSKTAWPVPRFEAMFLPEFSVKEDFLKSEFDVVDFIANGAYGKVYKVENCKTKRICALKVLKKTKIVAENAIQQAKQEVCIQRLVGHHIFILGAFDYWQERKTLNILTEYVCCGELLALVNEYGQLPEKVVRIYVAEIALAIDFLHNAGVIHRDIKASNILLDVEGHIRLIDFGLAKLLKFRQRTATFCGTFEYMAPEIVKKLHYGHEVDWWSLGVLACFLLTREYPSHATLETLDDSSINLGTLPNVSHLSKGAVDLLQRLLHPEPALRLKSILGLQRIAFFMGHNISSYTSKEVSPFELLNKKVSVQEKLPSQDNLDKIYSLYNYLASPEDALYKRNC